MAELTAQGFKRKKTDEYISELEAHAKELWGANVNLSDRSNLGKFIKLIASRLSVVDETMEDVYNNDFYDKAEGVNLDKAVKRIGLSRIQERYAEGTAQFTVDPGISIPQGLIIATSDGISFTTQEAGTETGGKVTVAIKADAHGTTSNVPAGTITVIKTPLAGVLSVTNPQPTTEGRNRETDADLKQRADDSLAKGGSSTSESVKAALLELPDVKDALVDENDTMATVGGIPAKSIAPFVYGGTDADVARVIFDTKSGGIQSYGTTIVPIVDSVGKSHSIGFTRPSVVNVWMRVTLTKNGAYPVDGNAQVKTQIVKYIGGEDADGTEYVGLGLGDDVIRYKVSAAAGAVAGIDDLIVETSTNGSTWTQSNISINSTSIANTDHTKVVIV